MSPPEQNTQTSPPEQSTHTSSSNNGQATATALAAHMKAKDTPAMTREERIKLFEDDKGPYARSVIPYNEGGKPDGKAHS